MAEPVNLDHLRLIIDGYQGTVIPLNRTSLREVFDEVEVLRAKAEYLESRLTWNASEVDRMRPVVEAARAFVEHQQRGQPGTPGTLYPMTYGTLDQWHAEWDLRLDALRKALSDD